MNSLTRDLLTSAADITALIARLLRTRNVSPFDS
jgi:hypothetical protein